MFNPFSIRQAYIINYTLAFLPQMVTDPGKLRSIWRPVSAFADPESHWQPRGHSIPHIGELADPPNAMWPGGKWYFRTWPKPRVVNTEDWQLEWLPDIELPPGSNPSTRLFIHVYPFGVVSIVLATAVGFPDGLEITPFINLLKQMTPAKSGKEIKSNWLRIVAPDDFAGTETNLDGLAEMIVHDLREALFVEPATAKIVRMERQAGDECLDGHHGGLISLAQVDPQKFDREKHAAGFRGIVTMRAGWTRVIAERLVKYQEAAAWTGWPDAWHFAGGLNTVLWHDSLPKGRGWRGRRDFTWLIAAVSEMARMEKVLYQYSRDFVVRPAHDRLLALERKRVTQLAPSSWPRQLLLSEWTRFWLALADAPRVLNSDELRRAYNSHARAMRTDQAREDFRAALEEYRNALEKFSWVGQDLAKPLQEIAKIVGALAGISKFVSGFLG